MEPFPKRQRLYAPLSRAFPQSFDNQHAYYDDQPDELEDEFEDELQEDYEEVEEEEEEEVSDPDADLQQRRARLDYKLKSTFEAIFEKYGQDFEGVGDEIDLETGEVVVNNGHLLEMLDERDAGDTSRRKLVRDYTEEAEEIDDTPNSSLEETEVLYDEDEEREDEEEVFSEDEEMMEDDMILRGFAKANRFVQASPELGSSRAVIPPRREPRPFAVSRPAARGNALPSRTDILAQFGPQLGPQIVDFVSHQQVPNNSHVEPAWRAPELPSLAPVKHPVVRRVTLAPEVQRSQSPEASRSIWAPVATRGPRKPKTSSGNAVFQGHSVKPIHNNQPQNPFRRQSMDDLSLAYQAALPSSKRIRRNFTAEDDQIIVDWVARAKARGQKVLSEVVWAELEAKHPNHSAASWKARYKRCFTYLPDQPSDYGSESEFSAVEAPPALPGAKKKRTVFTAEDDEILVDWVEIGRERGLALWSESHWQVLADKHPHHSMKSWKNRYQQRFRYLWSNAAEDSESIASETSVGTHILEEREAAKARAPAVSHVPTRPPAPERPSRIRKPAQRDSRIISWSEAVNTIQSLDPVLHAEMLKDTRMMKASNLSFDYSGSMSNPTKSFPANEPRVNQSARGHQPRNSGRVNDFVEPENRRDSTVVEASLPPEETKVRAPCPHADCRPYGTIRYRLQRLDNEDLSEMCLHLFRVHHTTPFPCGESGCKRKGEDGFFMQADLVKHVRLEHPNAGALQRLRGRVDPELLDRNSGPPNNMSSVPLNDRPISRARDSDFMSPSKRNDRRITASSRPFSSSSDHDRTPRGATDILEASTSTPMTSLSSLEVNRSSGTTVVMREVSESQEIMMPEEQADGHINTDCAGQVLTHQVNEPASTHATMPLFQETLVEGPPLSRNSASRNVLPTPLASTWDSTRQEGHGPSFHHDNPRSTSSVAPESGPVLQLPKHISSSGTRKPSESQLPPPRKTTKPQSSSDKGRISFLPEPRNMAPPKKALTSQSSSRNVVDPSYEFSDEEVGIEPVARPLDLTSKTAPSALPPLATQTSTTTSPTEIRPDTVHPVTKQSVPTPAMKSSTKKPITPATKSSIATPANRRKSMLDRVLDDDYDELSLGADDFVFMFSRQRTDVPPNSLVQVKQEESTDTPQMVASVPARKRKLSMFRAGSDDELCVLGPSPPQQLQSTTSKPTIKTEDEDGTLPIPQPAKPKAGAKRVSIIQAEASSSQPKSQGRRMVNTYAIRTSTPLLDLTPSRSQVNNLEDREIRDSAAESSPPDQASSPTHPRRRTRGQREAGISSPLIGLLTPIRRKRWSGDPLKGEQVTVVVKTPGGTLRRCGEDAFECGRSFCFRCGVKDTRLDV